VLYNRRLKHCGFCGAQILESLRFTPEEIAAIDRQMVELEEQRKQRQRAAEEEEAATRRRAEDFARSLSGMI
jgi:regulator of protease activity HflC (stomatin/prohibitin superfamily)